MKAIVAAALACSMSLTGPTSAPRAAEAPAPTAAAPRPTDLAGALTFWRNVDRIVPKGWSIARGGGSERSPYEIKSRYVGLSFVTGQDPGHVMTTLEMIGRIGPKIDSGWHADDYARVGEAALIANKSAVEAVSYLRDLYAARTSKFWFYEDYARVAAAGLVTGVPPARAYRMMEDVRAATGDAWPAGAVSRLTEAALLRRADAAEVARYGADVRRLAPDLAPGWSPADYARVARAAFVRGQSAETALHTLDQTKRAAEAVLGGWSAVVYSRLAAAAILAGKTPTEAAQTLKLTWNLRKVVPKYYDADYGMIASAALLGRCSAPGCADPTLPW